MPPDDDRYQEGHDDGYSDLESRVSELEDAIGSAVTELERSR